MTLTKRAGGLLLVLALVLGLSAAAQAQTGAASITGLVTDQSGAPAPGVTVTAINQATNVAYGATSNAAGNYTITSVPIGTYVVKSELTGFKISATKPIVLEAKQIARLDFKMEVGGLEDTVEVTAESPVLQTETATVGEVISAQTMQSLPLNGRNPNQLALLLPGAITPNPDTFTTARNSGAADGPTSTATATDEQLPARRHRHERDGGQPHRLPAQPRLARRDQRGDEQLRG